MLDYHYFKYYYKMIAIDLSKQQVLDSYPKAIQQINFTGNLNRGGNKNITMFLIIEESIKTLLDFTKEIVIIFCFNIKRLSITL